MGIAQHSVLIVFAIVQVVTSGDDPVIFETSALPGAVPKVYAGVGFPRVYTAGEVNGRQVCRIELQFACQVTKGDRFAKGLVVKYPGFVEGDKLPIGKGFLTVKSYASKDATNQHVEFEEQRKTLTATECDRVFAVCETLDYQFGGLYFNDASLVVHSIESMKSGGGQARVAADITLGTVEKKTKSRVYVNDTVRLGVTDFKILSIHTADDVKSTFGWLTITRLDQ